MDDIDEVLYTVGEVAALFRITVRTLHHWEAQGLLSPTWRSWSNYRLYTEEDCARVQKILIYRATGMKLTDIKQLLDGAASDIEHLQRQRESLLAQRDNLSEMLAAIDTLMEDAMNKRKLTVEEIGHIVGDANFAAHQQEAEEAYGLSEDWAMYQQRTADWSKQNWSDAQAGVAEVEEELAQAVASGVAPDSEEAQGLVEKHRAALSAFFPVTPAKHFLISRGYVTDERFRAHYEAQQERLAQWLADAIEYAAKAQGVDTANPEWK
ncbi:MerR family transcriptional regulator [Corynebacterium sp.]|uniref:MerR family transcriptional regulator n=1 Tax=Corynebacterium sp. TaxID=1720 RepID=UPI0029145326|nr:MerR family transcriptional regulator [Corynebacterium sp.]MDU4569551.1 MerR family transcriptional regulator [Corynebacterium sp.]